ncbi:MAG: copper resistance protein NlpE [Brachymonas sp.]|nr:copper resistance protein NlpE [Brachymonas sp.]
MTTDMLETLETCHRPQRRGGLRSAAAAALCGAAMLAGGCTVVSLDSANWPPPGQAQPQSGAGSSSAAPGAARAAGSVSLKESWAGHYEGTAPCADCAGVRILLTLKHDNGYTLSQSYLESNRKPTVVHGRFSWSSDGTEITLDESGGHRRYAVSWIELRMLNRDGSPMLGLLGEQLTLKKRPQ